MFVVARRSDLCVCLLGPDGAPVAGYGIWVEASTRPTPRMTQLEAQRTGADGRARVRGLARGEALCVSAFGPRPKEAGDRLVDRFPAKQWFDVRVQDDELVLRLDAKDLPHGALLGRFVDRWGAPIAVRSCAPWGPDKSSLPLSGWVPSPGTRRVRPPPSMGAAVRVGSR